ncbi:MAG: peptidoglycan DD-metalloendopeptidase family protein [Deferribacteraceae bacterium]|nr:peptidoglycan DD-metalloendopeptidase family protein [Deferribacteraceae bacterium]
MNKLLAALFLLVFSGAAFAETYVVQRGDTLSLILQDTFTFSEVNSIAKQIKAKYPSYILKAGMLAEKSADSFALRLSLDKEIMVSRTELGEVEVELFTYPTESLVTLIQGRINTNLFSALAEIGESAELAQGLARIFEWEIDFLKDIRKGDTFKVVAEKRFVRGKFTGYGRVLAAEFNVNKRSHKAFWYKAGTKYGYFNENAKVLERGFLRVPLPYGRITSRFTDSRLHPVTQKYQPHYGVDYAAAVGTPVMVTASGVIVRKSYSENNGYFVEVRHSNNYSTFYLHLNGFNNAVKQGAYVNQGDVIGYVGKSGMATGPHLDYRIRHKNRWLNPLDFIAEVPVLERFDKKEFALLAEKYTKIMNPVQIFDSSVMYAINTIPVMLP